MAGSSSVGTVALLDVTVPTDTVQCLSNPPTGLWRLSYEASQNELWSLSSLVYEGCVVYSQKEHSVSYADAWRYSSVSCNKPLEAYRSPSGAIVFDRVKSATKVSFKLPCGQCLGCRLEKSRQWGMRCLHEAKVSSGSAYLTLTYADEYMPEGGTLLKRDLSLCMKRLHNRLLRSRGKGIRYFGAGEYGGETKRPHYHVLVFNWDFPDKVCCSRNFRGDPVYYSVELAELWPLGFHSIGAVTFDSAVYCAKYALKRVNGKQADAGHYMVYDSDGVVYEREREFGIMSRNPGIGAGYYEKFGGEVRAHDNVVINSRRVRPPRYYDRRTEQFDPAVGDCLVDRSVLGVIKRKRKRAALLNAEDCTPERLAVKEELLRLNVERKERKL